MDAQEPKIRWSELITDLAGVTNKTQLARRLGVTPKEIARWINAEAVPQGANAQKIREEADRSYVSWRKYLGPMPIYDVSRSYEMNLAHGPHGVPRSHGLIPSVPTRLFGRRLNSPLTARGGTS